MLAPHGVEEGPRHIGVDEPLTQQREVALIQAKLQNELAALRTRQEKMKAANAILRKCKNDVRNGRLALEAGTPQSIVRLVITKQLGV